MWYTCKDRTGWLHVYMDKCGPQGIPPSRLLYCHCQGYLLSLHCIGATIQYNSSHVFGNTLKRNENYASYNHPFLLFFVFPLIPGLTKVIILFNNIWLQKREYNNVMLSMIVIMTIGNGNGNDDDDINVALHIWIITYSLDKVILGHIQATGIHSACTKAFPKQVYIIPLHIPKS